MLQGISYKDFETVAEGSTGGKKYCAKQVDGLLWVEGEKRCVERGDLRKGLGFC